MRRSLLSIVVACGVIACGPSTRPEASAGAPAEPAAETAAPAAVVDPPAAEENGGVIAPAPPPPRPPVPPFVADRVTQLTVPATAGCVLETAGKLPVEGGLLLRVDPAGSAFLRVIEGGARLTWPAGPGAPFATLTRGGFTVQGFAPENVKVRAARSFQLAGVLTTTSGTSFLVAGSGKGLLVPTLATPLFRPKKPLEARPCKDFGLDVAKIDAKAGLPTPKVVKKLYVRAGTIPVSATATGEPVLDLSPALANTPVTLLEESEGRTRFLLEHEAGNVVGWAAKTDLLAEVGPAADLGMGSLGLIGHGAGSGHGSASLTAYECDTDLALYVDMTDAAIEDLKRLPYARVGTIQKKQAFKVQGGRGGLERLAGQRLEGVVFTGNGALTVASDDLRKCRRLREEKRK